MEEAGIAVSALVPPAKSASEKANQEIAAIVKRYPEKFLGFAIHNPEADRGRIREMLRHEVAGLGLKGVKVCRVPTREVLTAVAELRLPLLFHPAEPSDFHMIAQEFPQVPMIMVELGVTNREWAAHYEAIAIAQRYPNVYLGTAALSGYKYLELAAKELGAAKLIFASNAPERDSRVELRRVKLLHLAPADEAMVLGENISRLLASRV